MKIWLTRDREFSLSSGGLERVRVWFTKPVWVERKICMDSPFSYEDQGCIEEAHWEVCAPGRLERSPSSFGGVFGYGSGEHGDFARFVWGKVYEHFQNKPMSEWEQLEKEGKSNVKDFLLEFEISFSFTYLTPSV